jgi:hypothetical protein
MKTFLITFYQLSPEEKARFFNEHGLTGLNQTALHLFIAIQ